MACGSVQILLTGWVQLTEEVEVHLPNVYIQSATSINIHALLSMEGTKESGTGISTDKWKDLVVLTE
jgi:hypothetical protein